MEKEFIPYELALRMKALGFDEPCFGWYLPETVDKGNIPSVILGSYLTKWNKFGDRLSVPTYSQAFDWVRKKYNLDSYLKPQIITGKKSYDFYIWIDNNEDLEVGISNTATYEEAKLSCLEKLIEILEKQK
jgi:hypothetical protein